MAKKKNTGKEQEINVAFLGFAEVGKTSIIQKLLGNAFPNNYHPTVFEYYQKRFKMENKNVFLNISDTSGAYAFPAMDRLTISKSDVIALVFSLASVTSFRRVDKIASDIEELAPKKPIIFVGNKSEQKQMWTYTEDLEDYVMCTLNHAYIEMSAKYDDTMVDRLVKLIYEEYEISIGPYTVRKSTRNSVTKLTRKLSQSCKSLWNFNNERSETKDFSI